MRDPPGRRSLLRYGTTEKDWSSTVPAMNGDTAEMGPIPSEDPAEVFGRRSDAEAAFPRLRPISIQGHLEMLVTSESIWDSIDEAETLNTKARPGHRRQYTLMDVVLAEIAMRLLGSAWEAARHLGDPENWDRLRLVAERAFPNDSRRRLSLTAPSRSQHWRTRRDFPLGAMIEALDGEFKTRP